MQPWRQRIVTNPDVLQGRPTFRGTRISVEFVLSLIASGWTVGQILHEMPALERDDILAAQACVAEVFRMLVEREVHLKFLQRVEGTGDLPVSLEEQTS